MKTIGYLDAPLRFGMEVKLSGGESASSRVVKAAVVDVDRDGQYGAATDFLLASDANQDGFIDDSEIALFADPKQLASRAGTRIVDCDLARSMNLALVDPSEKPLPNASSAGFSGNQVTTVSEVENQAKKELKRAQVYVDTKEGRFAVVPLIDPQLVGKEKRKWNGAGAGGMAVTGLGTIAAVAAIAVAGPFALPIAAVGLATALGGVALTRRANDKALDAMLTRDNSPAIARVRQENELTLAGLR